MREVNVMDTSLALNPRVSCAVFHTDPRLTWEEVQDSKVM